MCEPRQPSDHQAISLPLNSAARPRPQARNYNHPVQNKKQFIAVAKHITMATNLSFQVVGNGDLLFTGSNSEIFMFFVFFKSINTYEIYEEKNSKLRMENVVILVPSMHELPVLVFRSMKCWPYVKRAPVLYLTRTCPI